jgi:hypothetical protein
LGGISWETLRRKNALNACCTVANNAEKFDDILEHGAIIFETGDNCDNVRNEK